MLEQIKQLYPLPFKFLDSYTKDDKNIFFGRESETYALQEQITERQIVLVYGMSGTGKTSLVNCGLANILPEDEWLLVNIRRNGNFIKSLEHEIKALSSSSAETQIETPKQFIKSCQNLIFQHGKDLIFIFDQFEELFIFGNREEKQAFALIIQKISKTLHQCRFLFILREEYLAQMTELEKVIPSIFENRVRIEKMTPEKAIDTIEKPCKFYSIELEDGFAETLIQKLNKDNQDIDLTYLQVFLDIVYQLALKENEEQETPLYFHQGLLQKAGNISDLLGRFLNEQLFLLKDRDFALNVLKSFVSNRGTKRQRDIHEIIDHLAIIGISRPESEIRALLQQLISLRILSDKDHNNCYHLRHDALATKIHEKISPFEKEQLDIRHLLDEAWNNFEKRNRLLAREDLDYIAPFESRIFLKENHRTLISKSKKHHQKAKKQKQRLAASILFLLLILMSAFSAWALSEKNKAERNERMFSAAYYNSLAKEAEAIDPTDALRLAEHAHSLYPSENITRNLHRIYANNRFYTQILRLANPPYDFLAFSLAPDERSFMTGHWYGRLRHYDINGNLIGEFIGHEDWGNITSVSFSPDGDLILSNAFDGQMILWNREGEIINVLEKSDFIRSDGSINLDADNVFHHSSFSPDGTIIAASDMRNGFLRIYDLDGNSVAHISIPGLTAYSFMPDSKTIITSTGNGTIQTHDIAGNLLSTFIAVPNARHITASPNGSHAAIAAGNSIHLFDLNGQKQEEMTNPSGRITSLSFSADGNYIIATTTDKKALMWHISGCKVAEMRNRQNMLNAAITADNNNIYTVTYYGIDRYETSGKLLHFKAVDALSASQNHWMTAADSGNYFLLVLENEAFIFDKDAGIVARIGNQGKVADVFGGKVVNRSRGAFSACEKYVILSFGSPVAGIFDLKGNLVREINAHNSGSYINAIAVSPTGNYVLTASQDSTAALWEMDGQIVLSLKHPDRVTAAAFSHDSQHLLTGDRMGNIKLWDIVGNLVEIFPKKHKVQVTHLGFSEDETTLWSFSDSGLRLLRVTGQDGIQHTLTDGGKGDHFLHNWSIGGKLLNSNDFNRELANRYAFTNDFMHVMVGYSNGKAQLFNRSGILLQSFDDHRGTVRAMAMSPGGKTIVTANDQGVYFWEPRTAYEEFQKTVAYEPLPETEISPL